MTTTIAAPTDVVIRIVEQQDRTRPALVFRGEPRRALDDAIAADVSRFAFPVIIFEDRRIVALDFDCHHWSSKPDRALVVATMRSVHPRPSYSWVTHGNGGRLLFVGKDAEDAEERAALAALSLAPDWSLEIKRDSRHPRGAHPRHPGATCSEPIPEPLDVAPLSFAGTAADPETGERWLEERGMAVGERYSHDMCPIDPAHASSDPRPVAVYQGHIHCFSCAGRGVAFPGARSPGHVTLARLLGRGGGLHEIAHMAREFVHFTHARVALKLRYPRASDRLLKSAYRAALRASIGGEGDSRIWMALDDDLDVLRGHGLWLHASEFEPIKLDNTLAALPWAYDAREV